MRSWLFLGEVFSSTLACRVEQVECSSYACHGLRRRVVSFAGDTRRCLLRAARVWPLAVVPYVLSPA